MLNLNLRLSRRELQGGRKGGFGGIGYSVLSRKRGGFLGGIGIGGEFEKPRLMSMIHAEGLLRCWEY